MDDLRRGSNRRRRRVPGSLLVVVVVSFALAGCGGDEPSSGDSPAESSGAVLPGGGLSVAEAIATDADPPLAVSGWLVQTDNGVRICSSYRASAADPCGEPSLVVVGDVAQATGEKVSLLGALDGDKFVVSSTAQG